VSITREIMSRNDLTKDVTKEDEYIDSHKRVYKKWISFYLARRNMSVMIDKDLIEVLQDGSVLYNLIEVLSKKQSDLGLTQIRFNLNKISSTHSEILPSYLPL